jgi:superfamily II DNA or RNA helicase
VATDSIRALARSFSARDRERGHAYFVDGNVTSVTRDGDGFQIEVAGSSLYELTIGFDEDLAYGDCTCPWFAGGGDGQCKHVWAALLELDRRGMLPTRIRTWDGGLPFDDDWDDETADDWDDDRQNVVVPIRPAPGGRATTAPWQRFFETVARATSSSPQSLRAEVPEEIVYGYSRTAYDSNSVTITTWGRSRAKSGAWKKWRRLAVGPGMLSTLDRFDRETIGLLHGRNYRYAAEMSATVQRDVAGWWIERIARAGKLMREVEGGELVPIPWIESDPCRFSLRIDAEAKQYQISGSLLRDGVEVPIERVREAYPGVVIFDDGAAGLEASEDVAWMDALRSNGTVAVPRSEGANLREALVLAPPIRAQLPPELAWEETVVAPRPILSLETDRWRSDYAASVSFDYGGWRVAHESQTLLQVDGSRVIRRNLPLETKHVARLRTFSLLPGWGGYVIRASLLGDIARSLEADGWTILINGAQLRYADRYDVAIESGIDWFDLHASANFGDQTVALPDLLAAIARHETLLKLPDGSVGTVPREWATGLESLASLGTRSKGAIRYRTSQRFLLDAMLRNHEPRVDASFTAMRNRMHDVTPVAKEETKGFKGTLRPYQREGLGWLGALRELSVGGCLADDMGLGKTVQVLALLESLRVKGGGPSLVVAPKSLLYNWLAEAARFAPKLRVLQHHGGDRTRGTDHFADYDVVLTTYATMRLDIEYLAATEFEYAILDEAQAIKNSSAQTAKAARLLRARHRLALSGTPVENHLGELWSIFDFLNPGMLGTARQFSRTFAGKSVPAERREVLARAIRPMLLRRTKEQVARDLPLRTEQTLYCELEGRQKTLYHALRDSYRSSLLGTIRDKGIAKSRMHILEALLRLRQAACHPGLIDGKTDTESAKTEALLAELREVCDSGHRALVFSQFTSFLAIVADALRKVKIDYCYLDGKTRNRAEVVNRFQSDAGPPVFLISLKAGGLGLNLTNADYVFLLDPWWNPAVEAQAIDRSHRIGQTRPVVAHRIIARDTVEEKILELQLRKREIAESIITEDNSVLRKLEIEDIEMLLS